MYKLRTHMEINLSYPALFMACEKFECKKKNSITQMTALCAHLSLRKDILT